MAHLSQLSKKYIKVNNVAHYLLSSGEWLLIQAQVNFHISYIATVVSIKKTDEKEKEAQGHSRENKIYREKY